MAAREGCANLLLRLRFLIDDAVSPFAMADNFLQDALDKFKQDFYQEPLDVVPRQTAANTVTYTVYRSKHRELEELTSGNTYVFRLFNSLGVSPSSSIYSVDYINGVITFTTNQAAVAYYLDGRSFDLNAAAAYCWRRRASENAKRYDFKTAAAGYSRSQWFKHCQDMAEQFESMAKPQIATLYRGDMNV